MSVSIISGSQLDNVNSSSKRPQLDNNDFVEALNSNLSNNTKKNTYPVKEKPQQAQKDKQPTQQRSESHSTNTNSTKANSNNSNNSTKETKKHETAKPNNSEKATEIVEQPTTAQDSVENNENLMLSGSLVMGLELALEPVIEAVDISPEVAIAIDISVNDKQILTDNIALSADNNVQDALESSKDLPSQELLANTSESESSNKTEIASAEEKDIFIPEAIVSSEAQQVQQIITVPTQEVGEKVIATSISETPIEVQETPQVVTASDDMPENQLQQNLNEKPTNTIIDKQAMEKQVGQTSLEPQILEQAAVGSVEANNANNKKTESKQDLKTSGLKTSGAKTNANPTSIVESVKVEPIQNLGNMNPEMSFASSDENMDIDFQNASQDLGEIPHFDATAKPLTNQAVDTNLQKETTEDMNSISNQLKSAIKSIDAVNGKRITITLTPESLGRVEVELTTNKAGHITAIEIKAVKPETLSMLEKNSQLLQDALKEVTPGNDASLSFNLKEGNHDGSQQQQNAKKATDTPIFDPNNTTQIEDTPVTPRSTIGNNTQQNLNNPHSIDMEL